MKRAVVIYLENKKLLMMQFAWFYTSLKFINSKDTDIVVFGTQEALERVPDDCVKVQCNPISYLPQWKEYHFINSIYCLVSENSDVLNQYDMILRTDADTFLTSEWNSFHSNTYTVGLGKYVNDYRTKLKIVELAKSFGLYHQGIHNVGSTHYGPTDDVREVCRLSLLLSSYLLNVEFAKDPGKWPGWFRGVTTMYGGEIAVNHLIKNLCIYSNKLDYYNLSTDQVKGIPHIHCWKKEQYYKSIIEGGLINNRVRLNLDINVVKDYCLYIIAKSQDELPQLYLIK